MTDGTFFSAGEISVTSTLVTLAGGKTYATANITSVTTEVEEPEAGCAQGLMGCGGFVALVGLILMCSGEAGGGFVVLLLAAGVIVGGVHWRKSLRPQYVLKIASAAGEVEGMRSPDRELVESVNTAIRQAISVRG